MSRKLDNNSSNNDASDVRIVGTIGFVDKDQTSDSISDMRPILRILKSQSTPPVSWSGQPIG